jgi:hypothetical protein
MKNFTLCCMLIVLLTVTCTAFASGNPMSGVAVAPPATHAAFLRVHTTPVNQMTEETWLRAELVPADGIYTWAYLGGQQKPYTGPEEKADHGKAPLKAQTRRY